MPSVLASARPLSIFMVALACLLATPHPALAQDGVPDPLRAKFQSEPDPVKKAKLFSRFGDSLYRIFRNDVEGSNYEQAEKVLLEYRDTAKSLHTGLKAAVPDPEKKAGGFKQLQIHVRKTIHNLGQTLLRVPIPLRVPFLAIRNDLESLDKQLLDDLFPRQPGRRNGTEKPKG